jgi:hypothetical protein
MAEIELPSECKFRSATNCLVQNRSPRNLRPNLEN